MATAALVGIIGVIFLALYQDANVGPEIDRGVFDRRVRELAGPGARECGAFRVRNRKPTDPELADRVADCARIALAEEQPFWIETKGRGIDSNFSQAIVVGPVGKAWVVYFSDDVAGGSDWGPKGRLAVRACGHVRVPGFVVECR